MKVINLSKKDFKYQTKGQIIVLKAGEITEVDDTLVLPKKLKDCYGNRIRIIDENAIVAECESFSGGAEAIQPEPINDPEDENNGDSNEGDDVLENGVEGTKEPEENSNEEGTNKDGKGAQEDGAVTKENKPKKQTGKKASKNKNKK